jgi:non-specific serine/threonine protein kinase
MTIETGQKLSHYRLIEKIGEGGMGVVWKAEDTVLGRTVAIKVLPADVSRDEQRRKMFLQEAQLASQVSAAHVAQVHEFGREGDLDFIVMEYVEGNPLSKLLHGRPLPPHKVADFGYQIAHALSRAHRKNLLHRDLKPANVIVTPDGEVKVLDFGLATLFERSDTVAPSQATTQLGDEVPAPVGLAGTLPYMSPEQARMEALDARSDVFSLGTMLYEMTTGQLPFSGPTSVDVLQAVRQARPKPVHDLVPKVPLELERIIQKAMASRRGDRYQAVEDLAVDLKRLGKELESGSSPSYEALHELSDRSVRRVPRRLSATLIGLAVLTIIAAAVAAFFWLRPTEVSESDVKRIVVLPFENLGAPDEAYFADGMTEEITSRLAVVSGLGVISRTSAVRYADTTKTLQEIGEELGVGYVLEGTVRWDREAEGQGRVRITPQLIRVRDDTHLWADAYDGHLKDVFALQSEIAEQIVHELGVVLLASERKTIEARPTDNMEAYNAYLRGLEIAYPISVADRATVRVFERALELDPHFALAHAELARLWAWKRHTSGQWAPSEVEAAKRSVDEALRLAPDSPDVNRCAGAYYYWGLSDYPRAITHFKRTIELRPSDSYAHSMLGAALRGLGRFDEALSAQLKATELDPRVAEHCRDAGDTLQVMRRYAEADRLYEQAINLEPDNWAYYYFRAFNYLLWDGDTARAEAVLEQWPGETGSHYRHSLWSDIERFKRNWRAALEHVYALDDGDEKSIEECRLLKALQERSAEAACDRVRLRFEQEFEENPSWHIANLATVYALLDRKAHAIREGKAVVAQEPLSEHACNFNHVIRLAEIYATVGEQDAAIEQLDHLLSIPAEISVPMLRMDPVWDPLRDNPKFSELLDKYEP